MRRRSQAHVTMLKRPRQHETGPLIFPSVFRREPLDSRLVPDAYVAIRPDCNRTFDGVTNQAFANRSRLLEDRDQTAGKRSRIAARVSQAFDDSHVHIEAVVPPAIQHAVELDQIRYHPQVPKFLRLKLTD